MKEFTVILADEDGDPWIIHTTAAKRKEAIKAVTEIGDEWGGFYFILAFDGHVTPVQSRGEKKPMSLEAFQKFYE